MLFVLFHVGAERYALPARSVVEVLPLVEVRRLPHAAPGVAGLFKYRGLALPLVDLTEMMLGQPSRLRTTTRILVVATEGATENRMIGVVAERATQTARYREEDFRESGVDIPAAPYLGPVVTDGSGIIQRVEIDRIMTPEVREQLFRMAQEEA